MHLLSSLSSIVSTLYGYGYNNGQLPVQYGTYGGGGLSYNSNVGFQSPATNNPFNPTCPWPLINQMIGLIQDYVSQMQAAQGGPGASVFPFGSQLNTGFRGRMGPYRRKWTEGEWRRERTWNSNSKLIETMDWNHFFLSSHVYFTKINL